MTERQKILFNSASNVAYFATQVAVVFFVLPILVHGLGDNRYGVWTLVNSVIAYMMLADLGVGAAVVRYVARYDGLDDKEAINQVFSTSLAIFACGGASALLVTAAIAMFWKQPFGLADDLASDMRFMLTVLGVNFSLLLPMGNYKTVLLGFGKYPTVNVIRVSTLLVRNAAFVTIIWLGGGLRAIALAVMAGSVLDMVACAWAAHRFVPSLQFCFRFINRKTFRLIWGYSAFVFLSVIVGRIGSQSNTLVIGAFLPAAAVTYFGIAASLSGQAGDGLRVAIAVLTPAVSKWDALGNCSAVAALLVRGTRYLLYLAVPIQVGLLFLGRPFIALWMGPKYADLCYPPLAILALSLTVALAMAMASRILEGIGRVRSLFASTVIQAVLTVGLSLLLVRPFGILGVAWGTALPLAVQSIVVIVIACRACQVRVLTYLLQAWTRPLLAAVFLAVVWSLARASFPPVSSWTALLATGLAGLMVYAPFVVVFDSSLWGLLRQVTVTLRPRPVDHAGHDSKYNWKWRDN